MDSLKPALESESDILDMSHMKKRVTWDETTIAEHDKERGTRCVINEPKTPFNRLGIPEDPEENEEDNREQLLKRLMELDDSLKGRKKAHIVVSEEEEQLRHDEEKHKAFLKKRKEHYDEYRTKEEEGKEE
ncbi:protein phosphatase inhibitor [Blastocystis sp. subtype 4]|uniref:protein phosphatase inhibitor n=1 Tax=Blastocystis sp. subtype 4 TaxID=944170 RepID=UPI000711A678|nr:protein phosphatase inhibitor [Blastocystis sp. subtype 4]KNB45657.1 protein phosphatase inhibitor [Blastocystis sp. subtype 4]|eukprot:XP_014529100.1 protein phosphatase inhibitor [Blastocystis sp. subtype 4]